MYKQMLKENQPVVYQTLKNGFQYNRISHCYLFTGDKSTGMKEAAFLLAQSLICEHKEDGFACESCIECQRVADNSYFDVVYIDGSQSSIKIDAINKLQQQFEKTALEQAGRKVFIINDADNMTTKSANSLLKFIEEPADNITGIFITSQPERILPTIVSRCQTLSFKPLSKKAFYQFALEQNLDCLNAHLVSQMVSSQQEIVALAADDTYTAAIAYFCEFLQQFMEDRKLSVLYLQDCSFKVKCKKEDEKKKAKACYTHFLNIATIFAEDLLNSVQIEDETWMNLLLQAKEKQLKPSLFLQVISQSRDGLNRAANMGLAVDKMLYELLEV